MNENTHSSQLTFLPFQLTRLLDSHTYKILSILMNLRNIRKKIQVPYSELARFSGMSISTIQSSIKALEKNNFLSIRRYRMIEKDGHLINPPLEFEINDAKLIECMEEGWDKIQKLPQIKSSAFNRTKSRPKERKQKKSEQIRQHIDITKSAFDNLENIKQMGIVVNRSTVSNVLAEMRKSANYTKASNSDSISKLAKKVQEIQDAISRMEKPSSTKIQSENHNRPIPESVKSTSRHNEESEAYRYEHRPLPTDEELQNSFLFDNKPLKDLSIKELEEEYRHRQYYFIDVRPVKQMRKKKIEDDTPKPMRG